MAENNFYAKLKEKSTKKVEQKVADKREAAEPFDARKPNVYIVDGVNVLRQKGMMPTWVQDGERWHLNLKGSDREGVYHVSREGSPMIQYFFKGTGNDIEGVQPSANERGARSVKDGVKTKKSFDELPKDVKDFVRDNWNDILG